MQLATPYPVPTSAGQPTMIYPSPGPTLATSKATAFPTKVPSGDISSPDGDVARRLARVDEVQVHVLESHPVQIRLTLYGFLVDGCTRLASVTQSRSTRGIEIQVLSERPRGAMCTQALVPYEEDMVVDLSDLQPGMHDLFVNDVTTALQVTQDMLGDHLLKEPMCKPAPDVMVYREPERGYCMAYPDDMVICRPDAKTVMVLRLAQDGLGDPEGVVIESLGPAGVDPLKELVSDYLQSDEGVELAQAQVGGELAIQVSSPEIAGSQMLFWVYDDTLYRMRNEGARREDWEVLASSFAFD